MHFTLLFISDAEHYSEWGWGNSKQRKLSTRGKEKKENHSPTKDKSIRPGLVIQPVSD